MQRIIRVATFAIISLICTQLSAAGSPWGASYFPNYKLTNQDGKELKFFDDVVKDKVVAINFIYTRCPDTCPLETAQLLKVQDILGDRLGKDVFFYSISIDPEYDTPAVLKEYKERYGANWTFLTGKDSEITNIRRKLGLYIEEIQDGSLNHNVSMIIGNQKTGRWMKRSPFENPYVLADQIGNWLSGWKLPQRGGDYASAPKLRNISNGEQLFRTRCQTCHTLKGEDPVDPLGPDLIGVVEKRDLGWLLNWLRAPDEMLQNKDPIAIDLYKKYNRVAMPNFRLNQHEAMNIIKYLKEETKHFKKGRDKIFPDSKSPIRMAMKEADEDVVAVMNAWVREAVPKSKVNAGYMTLVNIGEADVTLVKVESPAYGSVEIHEMSMKGGMMKMQEITELPVISGSRAKLAPGGKHLMLIDPVKDFKTGDKVDLTLIFKSGKKQALSLPVKEQ